MGKRKIFTITFWVWTILSFCTAVSFKIQGLMRNEVVIASPEMSKDGMIQKIPASAVLEEDSGTGIYVIESKMGLGGRRKMCEIQECESDRVRRKSGRLYSGNGIKTCHCRNGLSGRRRYERRTGRKNLDEERSGSEGKRTRRESETFDSCLYRCIFTCGRCRAVYKKNF